MSEKTEKYSWFQNHTSEMDFTVMHQENETGTFVALTDTAEKADFIVKACNQFSIDKFEQDHPSPALQDAVKEYNISKAARVAEQILDEVIRAKKMFPNNFVNQHEAYAVILEEVDELWDEIKKNQKNYDLDAQRKEATQAAAMLIRLLVELL